MSDFELEKFPWLAVLAASAALNLILSPLGDFTSILTMRVPEILMLGVLGLELSDYRKCKPFVSFLVFLMWFLNQALIWSGQKSLFLWITLTAQAGLSFYYLNDDMKPLLRDGNFAYACLYMIAMFATVHILLGLTSMAWLWGVAVLLACLGYLLPQQGFEYKWTMLTPLGAALGFVVALWIGEPWIMIM